MLCVLYQPQSIIILWENVVGPKENHFAEPNQCVLTFLHSILFLLGPHTVMSTCGAALPALPEEEDIELECEARLLDADQCS